MNLQYAVVSTAGIVRPINEDNFYINGTVKAVTRANISIRSRIGVGKGLFAVSDGLGGEGHGEQASYIAVNALKEYQNSFSRDYMEYIRKVNQIICREQKVLSSDMGCTIAVLSVEAEHIMIMNIGDSRIYQFDQKELKVLSVDHSEFATMVKFGVLTEEDYYSSSTRNHLTRILGMSEQEGIVQPNLIEDVEWKDKDIFLICSDGCCSVVHPDEIIELLMGNGSLLYKCKKLVKRAVEHGSDDNITVMLIKTERY